MDTMPVDDASMHKIENIQQKIKDCGTKISMISGGLTMYLQPLDVSINKSFKDELRKIIRILHGTEESNEKHLKKI